MTHEIVINACYSGFDLSDIAIHRYYELAHPETKLYFYKYNYESQDALGEFVTEFKKYNVLEEGSDNFIVLNKDYGNKFTCRGFNRPYSRREEVNCYPKRTDLNLIKTVKELKERASGIRSKLVITEFEGDYYRIEDYDGYESIATPDTEYWEKVD